MMLQAETCTDRDNPASSQGHKADRALRQEPDSGPLQMSKGRPWTMGQGCEPKAATAEEGWLDWFIGKSVNR